MARRKKVFKKKVIYRNMPKTPKAPKVANLNKAKVVKMDLRTPNATLTVPEGQAATNDFGWSYGDVISNDMDAFINLYDECKLTAVTVEMRPRGNIANAAFTQDNGFNIYTAIDHSDLTTLTSVSQVLEYANCKKHPSWKGFKRTVPCTVPIIAEDCNGNKILQTQKPQWLQLKTQNISPPSGPVIAINNAVVAHLGMKFITDVNEGDEDFIFDVFQTYHFLFRNKN